MFSLQWPFLLNPLTKTLWPLNPHAIQLKRPCEPLPLGINETQHGRYRELELFDHRLT